jgi:hypothetical protein
MHVKPAPNLSLVLAKENFQEPVHYIHAIICADKKKTVQMDGLFTFYLLTC